MNEKVLVIYFSQSGQLLDIANNFLEKWQNSWDIDYKQIEPTTKYRFPWTYKSLFDVFPECVLEAPCEIKQLNINTEYDAVIFCFQIWFLHPSIPALSFASSPEFNDIVRNKPVYLLSGCRNSWRYALDRIEDKVQEAGGILKSSSIFRDTAGNLSGAVTILYWLFTGKKKRFLGIFPIPGVSEETIRMAQGVGEKALKEIDTNLPYKSESFPLLAKDFTSLDYEKYVIRRFKKWANYIVTKNRRFRLNVFKTWILFTIIFIAPIVSLKAKIKTK